MEVALSLEVRRLPHLSSPSGNFAVLKEIRQCAYPDRQAHSTLFLLFAGTGRRGRRLSSQRKIENAFICRLYLCECVRMEMNEFVKAIN